MSDGPRPRARSLPAAARRHLPRRLPLAARPGAPARRARGPAARRRLSRRRPRPGGVHRPDALLARRERPGARRARGRRGDPELRTHPRRRAPLVPPGALDPLRLVRERRPGFPLVPVGQPAARGGVLHALRHPGRAAGETGAAATSDGGVPHALARVPHELRVGGRQAADRRSHVAEPERDGDLLRDRSTADVGRLVRSPAPAVGAAPVGGVHPARRARARAARLGPATRAPRRLHRHGRDADHHRADGELRLLQLPHDGARALRPRRPRPRPRRGTPRPPARAGAASRPEPHPDGAPGRRGRRPRAALGRPLSPLLRRARVHPRRAPARNRPEPQRLSSLRAHDARPERGRHRGERGRRDVGALRVPLQAGRPHAAAPVRRPAPAARRLPALVPLFARDPFPQTPPQRLRVAFYRYRFTDVATRRATGAWWSRELLGYSRPLAAKDLR
ncbi:MAG: lipase maturation factor family protein [Deltaproteobacteria bacterium]|nr:MAG: lipase maturation factor family protein [Deltaproteobacteria bacterium]